MSFSQGSESFVDIQIRAGGKVRSIKLFPSDRNTRSAFFRACGEIKAYGNDHREEICQTPACDNTRDLTKFNLFLAEKIDHIYGNNVAEFITDGQCRPDELIRFLCETASFFKNQSERLIGEYVTGGGNEVME